MQLKYSNYVAFSHFHDKAVNNSGVIDKYEKNRKKEENDMRKMLLFYGEK